jgi:hypothetical protein
MTSFYFGKRKYILSEFFEFWVGVLSSSQSFSNQYRRRGAEKYPNLKFKVVDSQSFYLGKGKCILSEFLNLGWEFFFVTVLSLISI